MNRWVLLIVLVVGLSAAGTVAVQYIPESNSTGGAGPTLFPTGGGSAGGGKAAPKVVLDEEPVYEFGTLPQFTTGKHVWTVKNDGPGDLELWMDHATCSCTVAKFKNGEKAVVKPGETTPIELEFETRENNGTYEKGADIGTNDPARPMFELRVRGTVYPAVMTYPPEPVINLSTISNDEDDHPVQIAVFSKDRPETKIVKVASSNANVGFTHEPLKDEDLKSLPPKLEVKQGEKLTIHVKSGLPLGLFREEVVVTTDHPKQPEVRMTVSGKMIGPVNALPGVVVMHDVTGNKGATREAMLVVRNQRPTKFEVLRKPEKLQVKVVPADGNKPGRYRLLVTVPPGTPADRIDDEIVLKTDHPKAATVFVPVSIWVQNNQ